LMRRPEGLTEPYGYHPAFGLPFGWLFALTFQ
jgi:hypothetical protein